jgi:hypothetical protein
VNTTQVIANWLVGREIVEEEQRGKYKAEYGKRIIAGISKKLQKEYGAGYSVQNLFYMRQFYNDYPTLIRQPEIFHAVRGETGAGRIFHALRGISLPSISHTQIAGAWKPGNLNPNLSWTHYRSLLKVKGTEARAFYEIESIKSGWSARNGTDINR